jgi:rubredoxin
VTVSPGTVVTPSDDRVDDATRLECRICWHVYDPAEGDEVEQIPPGTPFSALPDHWRCPECDAEKSMFLPLPADTASDAP